MGYSVKQVEVWAGDIMNRPGMLARVLEGLSAAGAKLEFVVARQVTRNTSRVFVAPLKGVKQKRAAADVGLVVAKGMYAIRIDGADRSGLGSQISRAVASAGINIRGMSAAAVGRKAVFYLGFASQREAGEAAKLIRRSLARKT